MRGFICTTQPTNIEVDKIIQFNEFEVLGNVSTYSLNNEFMILVSGRTYTTDITPTKSLLLEYIENGDLFINDISGEYGIIIIDKRKNKILIYTDTMGIKNIFYSISKNNIVFASRESELKKRNINSYVKAPRSSIVKICMKEMEVLDIVNHSQFNLNETKNTYDDCIEVLEEAIRVRCLGERIATGISSGHDSACILQAAINTNTSISCYYIDTGTEDGDIMLERKGVCDKNNLSFRRINYLKDQYLFDAYETRFLAANMEDYSDFMTEPSTNLLSKLFKAVSKDGNSIFITGVAGDEITANYKYQYKNQNASTFNWSPTFDRYSDGREHNELNQNEFISEIYGIEIRYPFLDKRFIQEFLNLSKKYKNKYKGVLAAYLDRYQMSYNKEKIGFSLLGSYNPTTQPQL